ncbi:MAG: hypothetical protein V2A62_05095 [Candidatus Woesearchaeota archaeon]
MNIKNIESWCTCRSEGRSDCGSGTGKGFHCCSLMVSRNGNPTLLRRVATRKNLFQRHYHRDRKIVRKAS